MLSLSRQWSSPHWPQGHGNCVYVSVSQLAVERKKEDGVSLSILFSFFVIVSACEVACFCNLIYSAKHTLFYAWWLFCTVWVHYLQMACCFFSLFYFAQLNMILAHTCENLKLWHIRVILGCLSLPGCSRLASLARGLSNVLVLSDISLLNLLMRKTV